MTTISPTNPALSNAQPPGAKGSSEMGQAAFLRLMTAQVKAQDPFKPMDQTQMVAQLAQFSQVAGIGEMNLKLDSLTELGTAMTRMADGIAAQTALLERIDTRLGAQVATPPAP